MIAAVPLPGAGLDPALAVLIDVAFFVIVALLVWSGVLFAFARRAYRRPPRAPDGAEHGFLWVFIVPALDEELTIADSVRRLLEVDVSRKRVVVVDDGSTDRTAQIVAGIDHPDLHLLRREPPRARQGKAAALNHAYRQLDRRLLGGADREHTVVGVVDADGRLHPDAPAHAAAHFLDPGVGGVQSLVRIYNRRRPLTWMQDVEFGVYGFLYQAGRNRWGTAGMGGNGQFNRLSALDDVAGDDGPWRDRLTEDQDLGLRLIAAGWKSRQELRAVVEQQGLANLRRLFRQRTRWSQGNLQAMGLVPAILRGGGPRIARIEQVAYLLMPLWQAVVGAALVAAIVLLATGAAPLWAGEAWWHAIFLYVLAFGGTLLGCLAARSRGGAGGWAATLLTAHAYAFYAWLLWPVLVRAAVRQITERRDWVKTAREPVPVVRG